MASTESKEKVLLDKNETEIAFTDSFGDIALSAMQQRKKRGRGRISVLKARTFSSREWGAGALLRKKLL